MIAAPMPHTGSACSAWEPLVHFLVDGELDVDDQRAVTAHLRSCRVCTRTEHELVTVRRQLRLAAQAPLPLDLLHAIRDDLDGVDNSAKEQDWFMRSLIFAVAAVVVGAIALG